MTTTAQTKTDRFAHATGSVIVDFIGFAVGAAYTGLLVWLVVQVLHQWTPAIPRMPYWTALGVAFAIRSYHKTFQVTADAADRKTRRAA